jgi:ADP-ribosyl-[dinitrogen reductase] hydrolase
MRSDSDATVNSRRDRARGALLGLAVGDALGTTLEFKELQAPPFPRLAAGPHREVIGGGPFHVAAGQVTDDTQMATCLATSLRECRGFDAVDVTRRYLAWRPHAFDIGTLTSQSLRQARETAVPMDAGKSVWLASGRRTAGNGSLMRTAPIGVALSDDEAARRRASLDDSAITHFDPRCQLACAALNTAIAYCVRSSKQLAASDVVVAAAEEIRLAAAELYRQHHEYQEDIEAARRALADDLAHAQKDDPLLYGPDLHLFTAQGFVRVAFRLAFWELLHAPTFEDALVDVVNRGGDTDTNGAIAGALLGAFHGESAIPHRWRRTTLDALSGEPGPFRDTYHPNQLLALLDGFQ